MHKRERERESCSKWCLRIFHSLEDTSEAIQRPYSRGGVKNRTAGIGRTVILKCAAEVYRVCVCVSVSSDPEESFVLTLNFKARFEGYRKSSKRTDESYRAIPRVANRRQFITNSLAITRWPFAGDVPRSSSFPSSLRLDSYSTTIPLFGVNNVNLILFLSSKPFGCLGSDSQLNWSLSVCSKSANSNSVSNLVFLWASIRKVSKWEMIRAFAWKMFNVKPSTIKCPIE